MFGGHELKKMKSSYTGLQTARFQTECQPLMAESSAKIKVKTDLATSTEGWVEETDDNALTTSITSDTQF